MADILLALVYASCGVLAGWEARRKGYSDWLFLILGLFFGPLALVGSWFLRQRRLEVGTPVRATVPIQLEDGSTIPTRHVSVVRRVRDVDGVTVCQITAEDRSLHWVVQEGLIRLGPAQRPFGYLPPDLLTGRSESV